MSIIFDESRTNGTSMLKLNMFSDLGNAYSILSVFLRLILFRMVGIFIFGSIVMVQIDLLGILPVDGE